MSKRKNRYRLEATLRAQTHGFNFVPSIFTGQEYIPHNPRQNRKTKKGKK